MQIRSNFFLACIVHRSAVFAPFLKLKAKNLSRYLQVVYVIAAVIKKIYWIFVTLQIHSINVFISAHGDWKKDT
jgi:hypothetical protein